MEELKNLHEQITELWKLIKAFYPVHANDDREYWEEVVKCSTAYGLKYPKGNLGYYLVLGWLEYLQNSEKPKEDKS